MLRSHSVPLFDMLLNAGFRRFDLDEFLGTVRLLLNNCGIELETYMLGLFRGPIEGFLSLVQYIDVPYYETSITMRGDVAVALDSPNMFRAALHPRPISSADIVVGSRQR